MAHRSKRISRMRRGIDSGPDTQGRERFATASWSQLLHIGRGGLAVGVVFFILTVLIINLVQIPPDVQRGDRARGDLIARVEFSHIDGVKLAELQQGRRNRTLGIYGDVSGWRVRTFDVVEKVVRAAVQADGPAEVRRRVRKILPKLDDRKIAVFSRTLPGSSLEKPILKIIGKFAELYASRNILSSTDFQEEIRHDRKTIHHLARTANGAVASKARIEPFVELAKARELLRLEAETRFSPELDVQPELRTVLANLLSDVLTRNRRLEDVLTVNARNEAAQEVQAEEAQVHVRPGAVMVHRGEVIDDRGYEMIVTEHSAYLARLGLRDHIFRIAGSALGVMILFACLALYLVRYEQDAFRSLRKLVVFGVLNLVVLALAEIIVLKNVSYYLIPIGLMSMVTALVFGARTASVATLGMALILGMVTGGSYPVVVTLLVGGLVAGFMVERAQKAPAIPWAGVVSGVTFFITVFSLRLLDGEDNLRQLLEPSGWGLLNGIVSGVLVLGLLPVWEWLFGVTTNIKLLELSDHNHPALRDLERRAPGTYQHSLHVGILCEAACEAIGADALLARVAAYYHDIGKVWKPEYFAENAAPGRSRHDGLAPTVSAIIIISHVKDGAELAREYRLPDVIVDFIEQHHGTTLVEYFYRQAVSRAKDDGGPPPHESFFRYPGPKPKSREAAVMLLADTVEAASRTLQDPSPARLMEFVGELSANKLMDGQFDSCPLTLEELRRVEEAIYAQLCGMFHHRVQYPGQAAKPTEANAL